MTPIKRILTMTLSAALATTTLSGSAPAADGQQRGRPGGQEGELMVEHPGGRLGGSATDEAKKPYTDYLIRIRNVSSSQPIWTIPLDPQGKFYISGLPIPDKYLVELHLKTRPDNNIETRLVCTEGPFELKQEEGNDHNHFTDAKLDIDIECGQSGAWLWMAALAAGSNSVAGILASGSGITGSIPPVEQSPSR